MPEQVQCLLFLIQSFDHQPSSTSKGVHLTLHVNSSLIDMETTPVKKKEKKKQVYNVFIYTIMSVKQGYLSLGLEPVTEHMY